MEKGNSSTHDPNGREHDVIPQGQVDNDDNSSAEGNCICKCTLTRGVDGFGIKLGTNKSQGSIVVLSFPKNKTVQKGLQNCLLPSELAI